MRSTVHAALLLGASLVVPGCGAPLVAIPDDASAGMDALADAADARLSPDATSDASDGGACAAGCLVLATCHADGALNPANACEICDVAVSRTAFSPNDGRACDDGAFCTGLVATMLRFLNGTAIAIEHGQRDRGGGD